MKFVYICVFYVVEEFEDVNGTRPHYSMGRGQTIEYFDSGCELRSIVGTSLTSTLAEVLVITLLTDIISIVSEMHKNISEILD